MANYTICQLEFAGLLYGRFPAGRAFRYNLLLRNGNKRISASIPNAN